MGIVEQHADRDFDLDRPPDHDFRMSVPAVVEEIVLGMLQDCDDEAVTSEINRQIVCSLRIVLLLEKSTMRCISMLHYLCRRV